MAGETQKTTALTSVQDGNRRMARLIKANKTVSVDTHQFAAATELEAADVLITAIELPSNAIVTEIAMYNDDMDTGCCPLLILDFGVSAGADYTSTSSSTETDHSEDDLIDADLFVDGATTGQAATTLWTALALDSTTFGPDDALKPIWDLLGYDFDPNTTFRLCVVSETASGALGSAADMAVKVEYLQD